MMLAGYEVHIPVGECARDRGERRRNFVSDQHWISIVLVSIPAFCLVLASSQAFPQSEEEWTAKLVSVEGRVEGRRALQTEWKPAKLNDEFAVGDSIRVQAFGRAAIRLPDETVLRLDQNTTITFAEPQDDQRSWLELLEGIIHVISRDPRALKVITPFANAGLEGTEFVVIVDPQFTRIDVFEGEVAISNAAGEIKIQSGESAVAELGQAPVARTVVRPRDAVQWTLYYPPIIGYELPAADEEPGPERINDPHFYTGRASQRLAVGRVEEAREDISKALSIDPGNVDALALQSVIALTQNDKVEALRLASRVVGQDPQSATALIALSYAQQAHFDLPATLATLQDAVARNPGNALAWSRLSELWLALGDLDQALGAAETAVSIDPRVARTQTVLGFALLMQIKIEQAIAAFEKAIEFDDAAPLPYLGLGLAYIRKGDLERGREQIEEAVIRNPSFALIRSYMGKAYYEETRNELAESQFEIAKELDPLDPTPWFYAAILKQSINEPVEALENIKESIVRNDNRAVFRSRLLLDEDLAARSANLGRIYQDLGFEQLALVEGFKSVNTEPANFSGHRFLADMYSTLPRHEIARVSEVLQSQLLQPININPIPPRMAETNLFVLRGAGPSPVAFNEFNPLFARDGFSLLFNGVSGTNSTLGNDLVVSGLHRRFSYSLGQYHYETDGFRENNDQTRNIYNAFVQAALSPSTSVQAELRSSDADFGDLNLLFDPTLFSPDRRHKDDFKTARVGLRHSFTPNSTIIASLQSGEDQAEFMEKFSLFGGLVSGSLDVIRESDSWIVEAQHLYRTGRFKLVTGVGQYEADKKETDTLFTEFPFPPFSDTTITVNENNISQTNFYVYSLSDITDEFTLTIGVSADFFDSSLFEHDQVNPKFGMTWVPSAGTTVRAAAFRTLQRGLVADQTIEPTQVAGFNQFFDDFEGDEAWRYGVAIDQQFSRNVFGGIEISHRDLDVVVTTIPPAPAPPVVGRFGRTEDLVRAYTYWTPSAHAALSAEYLFERFDRDSVDEDAVIELTTHRIPLGATYFWPSGWAIKLNGTYVDQDGLYQAGLIQESAGDRFWVLDSSIFFRLPKRRGIVALEAKNLLDQTFQFQDTDPKSPLIQPQRLVLFKINLSLN